MTGPTAFSGASIFDGDTWHHDSALLVADGRVQGIVPARSTPEAKQVLVDGAMLVPGFVDLQVNGGGGALLNDEPTLESIRTICGAFAQFGTTACLPTLVTDTRQITAQAVAAGIAAVDASVPGFIGLHLEGPHLSVARKGAHDPALIRPMDEADIANLIAARKRLPNLLVTIAAETVAPTQISRLADAGIVVSVGHSDAGYDKVAAAAGAGATMVTHLFNAQSQLGNRDPGVVGAALDLDSLHAGLIADGIHVHPASIGIALRAKRAGGRIFLVTDAMSLTGTDAESFELNGRTVYRRDGALRLEDGTLAGADLTMVAAVRYVHERVGVPLDEALRMASRYPADAMGIAREHGHLHPGARADIVVIGSDFRVRSTWIGGTRVFAA